MKEINPLDDSLKAVGFNSKGNRLEFDYNGGILHCFNKDLVGLEIPIGVKEVWCYNNLLTELILPDGVEQVYCWDNKLTELKLPEGVENLYCDRNVKGLDNIDWKCKITLG